MRNYLRGLIICLLSIASISLFSSSITQKEYSDNDDDKIRIKAIIEGKESANWVFTGNSITQGVKHTHGLRGYSEFFSDRL